METIEKIAAELQEAHQFNTELSQFLHTNFVVNSRTITQWKDHFYVEIPAEINFALLIKKGAEVARKYQEAAFFREKQNVQLAILEQAKINKYHTAYNRAREDHQKEFGKNLAADSCKVVASLAIKDIEEAISNQRIVSEFWNKTCATLVEMRKCLEAMGHALSAEARAGRDFVFKGADQ